MFPKDTGHTIYNFIPNTENAAIHLLGIAAFLVSTGFDAFLHAPPGTVFEYVYLCALIIGWVRFLLYFLSDYDGSIYPRCRSPPSDFDFSQSTKNRNSEVQYERN